MRQRAVKGYRLAVEHGTSTKEINRLPTLATAQIANREERQIVKGRESRSKQNAKRDASRASSTSDFNMM